MRLKSSRLDETFVSAERINQCKPTTRSSLIADIQLEEQESDKGKDVPVNWPSEGRIVIRDLDVRYADDLPAVLHDINLEIQVRGP